MGSSIDGNDGATTAPKQFSARPSSLACSECRKRHLKCNAALPVCERCAANGLECSYTPSRRGGICREKRRSSHEHGHEYKKKWTSPECAFPSMEPSSELTAFQIQTPETSSVMPTSTLAPTRNTSASPRISSPAKTHLSGLPDSEREHLTNLFYSNFHPAHPLLVPRNAYQDQDYPDYLRLLVCFVGSQYASNGHLKETLRDSVTCAMVGDAKPSAHRVQALVLHSIVLHAQNMAKEARVCIAQASQMAITIGINQYNFASETAHGDALREESLRRTWWELYIVEGYMAALHRRQNFQSNTVATHPYLPCEESLYARDMGSFGTLTLNQFQDRVFANDDQPFSSYCYRIEAVRIIARVLAVAGANDADPDEVQAADNAIASWKYHLPKAKADVIDQYGRVDHMLFQANMFVQWATILLHFPRSDLPLTVPTTTDLVCVEEMPRVSATSAQHTVKAIAASKELSNLAALPWCVTVHSPFFTCGLILGCIVQLSACSSHARNCIQQHRDRVTLMIGALKTLGETWAVARNALQHLMKVANGIFCSQPVRSPVPCCSSHDSAIDVSGVPVDMSWFDLFTLNELSTDAGVFGSGTLQ